MGDVLAFFSQLESGQLKRSGTDEAIKIDQEQIKRISITKT